MAKKILVISGKGGVGKSTVCACVAGVLAREGKKVLCIDADIGFRSLDLILRVGGEVVYNWLDVINGSCGASSALISDADGVALLASPSRYSDGVTKESFSAMLEKYDGSFDYIFIDAPAGSGDFHRLLAECSDSLILVVTPDSVCVRSAEIAVDRALEANPALESSMVINRFNRLEVLAGRQLKLDDVIDGTRTRLCGVIPESDSVRLLSGGEKVTDYALSAFERTAKRLCGETVAFNVKDFY